tara:strand:+ start:95 stop:406 length:312 start_codon:yes stop_codon:yes gene_type:complete
MATIAQKHFKISDKEWNRMSREERANKTYLQRKAFVKLRQEAHNERRENRISDALSKKKYGQGRDSRNLKDSDIRRTLNKAGYNIKQDTSAAQRLKNRYKVKK